MIPYTVSFMIIYEYNYHKIDKIRSMGGTGLGQCERLYEKIKSNPKDVKFEDIDKLLVRYGGFLKREGKGSHFIYKHPDLTNIQDFVTIPRAKPVKKVYVLKALRLFEQMNLLNK